MTKEKKIAELINIRDNFIYALTPREVLVFDDAIKALEQEPKTGHWIPLENWFCWGKRVKCSECGKVFVVGDYVSSKYCSNCGAKMESEDVAESEEA